jgi:hypothetical protein
MRANNEQLVNVACSSVSCTVWVRACLVRRRVRVFNTHVHQSVTIADRLPNTTLVHMCCCTTFHTCTLITARDMIRTPPCGYSGTRTRPNRANSCQTQQSTPHIDTGRRCKTHTHTNKYSNSNSHQLQFEKVLLNNPCSSGFNVNRGDIKPRTTQDLRVDGPDLERFWSCLPALRSQSQLR